jgi:hypothetical protein
MGNVGNADGTVIGGSDDGIDEGKGGSVRPPSGSPGNPNPPSGPASREGGRAVVVAVGVAVAAGTVAVTEGTVSAVPVPSEVTTTVGDMVGINPGSSPPSMSTTKKAITAAAVNAPSTTAKMPRIVHALVFFFPTGGTYLSAGAGSDANCIGNISAVAPYSPTLVTPGLP